jgi:5-methylcytosine-specific restriction endonuclease McrA
MPRASAKHKAVGVAQQTAIERRQRDRERSHLPQRRALKEQRYAAFRVWLLGERPLCERCGTQPSVVVHHVRRLRNHPEDLCNQTWCQALCKCCHDRATARGE